MSSIPILSRDEQRSRATRLLLLSVYLELELRRLVRETAAHDAQAISDFQQLVQYAPAEMRLRLSEYIYEVFDTQEQQCLDAPEEDPV